MSRHNNWRDCQAWRDEGLDMSSTSNEAVKLYDASLSQLLGFYAEPSVGGFQACVKRMIEVDETFVMGHVLNQGLKLLSFDRQSPLEDTNFRVEVGSLMALAENSETKHREKLHVNAIKFLAEDQTRSALSVWEEILLSYPTDMLAIKFSELGYLYVGDRQKQRDFKYKIFPQWKPNTPLYNYLFGMMAFAEMENGMYDAAEKNARRGIDGNPQDGWAMHALAHVMHHQGRYEEGIGVLTSTVNDWQALDMISCHIHWHMGLFYIEKGDFDNALQYYDSQIKQYNKTTFQGLDRASILLRFELEGVDVGERWADVYEQHRPHLNDHRSSFHDIHSVMACLGAKRRDDAQAMLQSMQNFVMTSPSSSQYNRLATNVGGPLCEALIAWDDKDFGRATELLLPVRGPMQLIGGSNAQMDVITQLLIHSALQSTDTRHHEIARSLITERRSLNDTPLTQRLMNKLESFHEKNDHCKD